MTTTNKYSASHVNPAGEGDARPTALQIIEDEGLVGQWRDKVVLITGASNGIGVETARALYRTGAHLFLPVRDMVKGEAVRADIEGSSAGGGGGGGGADSVVGSSGGGRADTAADSGAAKGRITLLPVQLDSLQSVREVCSAFLAQSRSLHLLVCNAGVMATPEGRTVDGWETQFGTNHLAHFVMFQALLPTLLASSTPSHQSRVVTVSSSGHSFSPLHCDDYQLKQCGYDPWLAYGQSKTANIYMANEIERRYGSQGLHALSVHPGSIRSGLQVHVTPEMMEGIMKRIGVAALSNMRYKSVAQGAATTVWAATAKVWEGKGGKYLENCNEALPREDGDVLKGYAPHAYDVEAAKQLWTDSCEMVGIPEKN